MEIALPQIDEWTFAQALLQMKEAVSCLVDGLCSNGECVYQL